MWKRLTGSRKYMVEFQVSYLKSIYPLYNFITSKGDQHSLGVHYSEYALFICGTWRNTPKTNTLFWHG